MGTPAISKHDLNTFVLDSHVEHVKELTDRGYTFIGFYCAENGVRELNSKDYREWFAFIWESEGKRFRTEQPRDKVVACDVTPL